MFFFFNTKKREKKKVPFFLITQTTQRKNEWLKSIIQRSSSFFSQLTYSVEIKTYHVLPPFNYD